MPQNKPRRADDGRLRKETRRAMDPWLYDYSWKRIEELWANKGSEEETWLIDTIRSKN